MNPLEKVVNYYWTGVVPNSMVFLTAPIGIDAALDGNISAAAPTLAAAAFSALVGVGKFVEYRKIRNALETHGWDERLVRPKMYSWCQRNAARQAAKHTGYTSEFDSFAESEGHKPYHVLPQSTE